MTVCGPALASAQIQVIRRDVNVTGNAYNGAADTSVCSIDDSSSRHGIRVPEGFGGVTTLLDGLNAPKARPVKFKC
jgi:hypothetical protein